MYQPKFKVAILKLDREVRDKEKELAEILKEKRRIEGEIDSCREEIQHFYRNIEEAGSITPFSIAGFNQNIYIYQNQLKEELIHINIKLQYLRKDYLTLSMKRDWLKEKERENERIFYDAIRKKEEREVEEIKRTQEYIKRRG